MHPPTPTPRSTPRPPSRLVAAVAGALVCVLALAGCAHMDLATDVASLGSPSDTTPTGTTPTGSTDPEQAARDFAKCMREHGIDMPDPQVSSSGSGKMMIAGKGPTDGGAPDADKLEAADKECRHFMDGVAQDAERKMDPAELEKMKQQALDFSKCMREHGIDMPDPQFEDSGSGGGVRMQIGKGDGPKVDPESPAFQDAQKACAEFQPVGGQNTTGGGTGGDGPSVQVAPGGGSGNAASSDQGGDQ